TNCYLEREIANHLASGISKSHACAIAISSLGRVGSDHERKRFGVEEIFTRDWAVSSFDAGTRGRARRENQKGRCRGAGADDQRKFTARRHHRARLRQSWIAAARLDLRG